LNSAADETGHNQIGKDARQGPLPHFLIPCSCGRTFAVSEDYDRKGMHIRSFIPCPNCGKRHDPRNRVLHLDYQDERFWTVGGC